MPKGKRVKIEFEDVDFLMTRSAFMQRIGIYNDFSYSSKLKFITNATIPEPIYSSDNKMMIIMWVRLPSSNRGFKLKFSSEQTTICAGNLNGASGGLVSPNESNLTTYSCSFVRDNLPIIPGQPKVGTIAYYFKNIEFDRKVSNCRYTSTSINVKRGSGKVEEELSLGRICSNETTTKTILSPFPDVTIEVRQGLYVAKMNYSMEYRVRNRSLF